MAEILVVFPERGKGIKQTTTYVRNDLEVASSGDKITWSFHSADKKIKKAKVTFQKPKAQFFKYKDAGGNPQTRNEWIKELDPLGKCLIYGEVPNYGGAGPSVEDKYTVFGLAADGKTILSFKDPRIFTDKP